MSAEALERVRAAGLLKQQALIDGTWIDSDSGEAYPVHNPSSGEVLARVATCGGAEARRAVIAAQAASEGWRRRTPKDRSAVLQNWFSSVMEHQDSLALLLSLEQGKPLSEARGEIAYGASYIQWFAEEAKRVYGDVIPAARGDQRAIVVRQPVGVVACITPWNFPNAMLARKIAPALAAGCTVVCKPANETPLSAHALAVLAERAGVPPGVINIVSGRTLEIGAELTSNPIVRKLTFTGSTKVGKSLVAACAHTLKRTSMELGGNAPFIVFADADLDEAVKGAMLSKYRNAGQTCVCTNRILVQDTVYEEFTARFVRAVNELKVGDGSEPGVTIGPLITRAAADAVHGFVDDAVCKGARIVAGGGARLSGNFVKPIVLADVDVSMRVFSEEIFGPVAPLIRFGTEAEAIRMANDTPFGLACYLYSRDLSRVWRVAEQLEYGMVGINEGSISNEMAPFGGIKESGHGREGSKYGLDDYLDIKYLCMGGLRS